MKLKKKTQLEIKVIKIKNSVDVLDRLGMTGEKMSKLQGRAEAIFENVEQRVRDGKRREVKWKNEA